MDTQTIATRSVQKTGRCVIVNEGQRTCGSCFSEIIARINETAFEFLEAPIKRITGFDMCRSLTFQVEEHFLPESDEIVTSITRDTFVGVSPYVGI